MKTKLLIFLLLVGILTSLLVNLSQNRSTREGKRDEKFIKNISKAVIKGTKVLQIDLTGGIFYIDSSLGSLKKTIQQIDQAAEDDETKGLFIRVNSPGGSIVPSQEFYEAVKRFQKTGKPIVTSVMDLCASGCYYAILPSTTVIANRGSLVGSIGVIVSILNMEELYKKIGVRRNNFTSVKHKDMFSSSREMKPEEVAHLKKIIAEMHEDFVSDVVFWRERHSSEKILRKTANGMLYTTDMALKRGLIDKIGDLRFAQEEMANILEIPREDIRFVKPAYQYWEDILGFQVQGIWKNILYSFLTTFFDEWLEESTEDVPQLK